MEQPAWRTLLKRPHGLTPTDSQFLVTIWKLQQEYAEGGVPWEKIAAEISPWWRKHFQKDASKNPYEDAIDGVKPDMVRKLASELAWDEARRAGYVVPLLGDETGGEGEQEIGYGLVDGFMIRRPHTASTLFELLKIDYDKARPGERPLQEYLTHVVCTFRASCEQVIDEVNYAIEKQYLIAYPSKNPTHVNFGNRFGYENRFLQKLAELDPKRVLEAK